MNVGTEFYAVAVALNAVPAVAYPGNPNHTRPGGVLARVETCAETAAKLFERQKLLCS